MTSSSLYFLQHPGGPEFLIKYRNTKLPTSKNFARRILQTFGSEKFRVGGASIILDPMSCKKCSLKGWFLVPTRPSVNYVKDWLDQLFLFPGLVWKRVSPMHVIARLQSTTLFLCIGPFLA